MTHWILTLSLVLGSGLQTAMAIDPYTGIDPYWVVLHEPSVQRELALTTKQKSQYLELLDRLDTRFFPLRNQNFKTATEGLNQLMSEARTGLAGILDKKQVARIDSIVFQKTGGHALLRDELQAKLKLNEDQRSKAKELLAASDTKVAALQKKLQSGGDQTALNKEYRELRTREQQSLVELLSNEQRTQWRDAIGAPFDLALLGSPAMKAPELIDSGVWVNAKPLTLESLNGKVTVVHFYAYSCTNCINNYEHYRKWHADFSPKDVTIVGIHTPETEPERSDANVKSKAKQDGFQFPILVDGKSANWNAWGNSMWPSVYLIDKRGYVRHFWPGELNWQGAKGEEFMRKQIEQLLAEETP